MQTRRIDVKKMHWKMWAMLGILWSCSPNALFGQDCKDIVYGHQNQIDPKPIELREVPGTSVGPDGTLIPKVCVGIFTELEHTLVRYSRGDDNGAFFVDLDRLPEGACRLVVQVPGFCPANAMIRIKRSVHHKRRLAAHMRLSAVDTCSDIELRKK
jgi:hypothetical protein